ncbi:hypothetical protein BV210_08050 [Halorientalis sp. IM1011]|uniref:hypothetical protein n=1 Tax=Halorientalis sp. IM1011 TaxID=1932360 RepID=UPI00097CD0FC|nr:hypothetical protein [Halorientalis sp. IM1011]AQL42666.1 hypothetical protein BV210_08050 [Halorientalis sp. IM1011]
MTDTPSDDLAEIDEDDLDDVDDDVRALIDDLRAESDAALRSAIRYTADDYDVLFLRDDVAAALSDAEREERAETLVMKGLGDPPQEGALFDFGTLDATMRFYDNVLVAHFPYREWSGIVFTFDRTEAPLVDLVHEHLDE